jgi:hypothetical protein
MTALLGGSVLLIAVSAASLVYGWLNGEDTFIWASIAATGGAAILVVIAYLRSSKEPVVVGETGLGGHQGPAPLDQTSSAPAPDEAATQVQPASTDAPPAPPSEAATAAMPAAAGAAVAGTAGDGDDAGTTAGGPATQQVVGIPKTKKFHKPECRFATAEGAEPMTRADAESRAFEPCGVCKP